MRVRVGPASMACALSGVLLLAACAREADEPAVAEAALSLDRADATLGSPVEMTYRFTVASGGMPDAADYRVLVHFRDGDEELMWTDDHDPPVPTRQWKPGQTIEYTRTHFIPVFPYIGDATILVGLYSPDTQRRLRLSGDDDGQRAYRVATIELRPQTENVLLIFRDGWHPAEFAPEDAAREWQWTRRRATIAFKNPKADAVLWLQLDGRSDLFPEPQRVTLSIGGRTVETFPVPVQEPVTRKVQLSVDALGQTELVELAIEVDKTFVPREITGGQDGDLRELGVRVYHAFIRPAE